MPERENNPKNCEANWSEVLLILPQTTGNQCPTTGINNVIHNAPQRLYNGKQRSTSGEHNAHAGTKIRRIKCTIKSMFETAMKNS